MDKLKVATIVVFIAASIFFLSMNILSFFMSDGSIPGIITHKLPTAGAITVLTAIVLSQARDLKKLKELRK